MRVPPIRLRIEPVTKRDAADDRAEIKKARRHRWHPKNMFRVEHSHYQRGQRHQKDEGEHDAREQNSELRFLDGKPGRENVDENRSEDDAEQRDRAHKNERESGDLTRKIPRRLVALGGDSLGESRNECGRESAFCKEIAQHIRRAEGSQKRVHISRRAEERGEQKTTSANLRKEKLRIASWRTDHRCRSKLLHFIAPLTKQSQKTVGTTQMSGTNYDKICFITLKQAIDLRYPVVISTCDYPVGNAWDIVEHAAGNSPNPIGVALFPCAVQL